MSDDIAPVVLFQSNKFFWRTRNTIDVTIVQYSALNVTEIISYEPSLDKEAPRIYLNSAILATKVDSEEIATKVAAAKQKNVPQTAKFKSEIMSQVISDYILNRLFVAEFSRDPKKFTVKLQFNFRDRELESGGYTIDQIICEKPEALKPIDVVHHRILKPEEVTAAFKALEDAQRTLREQCNKAMEIQAETSALEELSTKERWRIPIVVARVAKNRRLSGADSRIWAAVSRNMTTQEAVEKLTRATLRPPVPRQVDAPVAPSNNHTNTNNTPSAPSTLIGRVFAIRSNRLFAPTVSSQNRFSAEEPKAKGKTLRKYFEREHKHSNASPAHAQSHSNSHSGSRTTIPNSIHKSNQANDPASTNTTIYPTAKTPKKSFRRGTKHPKHKLRLKQTDTAQEGQKDDDFDPEEGDENAASLVDHISTGLATLAATVSGKFNKSSRVHSASADEADGMAVSTGTLGKKKQIMGGGSATFRNIHESPENTLEKQSLPINASQAASSGTAGASAVGMHASAGVGANATAMAVRRHQSNHNQVTGAFDDEKSEMSIGQSSPSKARAFFAPFLASLSRKNTNTHLVLSTSPGKGLDASLGASNKESPNAPACHSHSTPGSATSPKPSPMRSLGSLNTFFGATLGRLMSWSGAPPNNQVLPAQ